MSEVEEWDNELRAAYPKMFPGGDIGIWVGEGWHPIVRKLCASIQHYIDATESRREWIISKSDTYKMEIPESVPQVTVAQIKEKFGQLRFYYDGGDQYISGLVAMAETWASGVCERCGDPGQLRRGGWMKVLCDKHEEERQADYKKRFGDTE